MCSATATTVSRPSRSAMKKGPYPDGDASPIRRSNASSSTSPSSCARHNSETAALRMRLTTKPGVSPQRIGALRIAWAKVAVGWAGSLRGPQRGLHELGDRESGGVGGEDGVPGSGLIELGEHGLLELHPLGDRLDDEV